MPFQALPSTVQIEGIPSGARDGTIVYVPSPKTPEGQVVVRYGLTKLTCDRLSADQGEERGVAEGHVVIVDPAGTAYADRIEFGWNPIHRYAKGDNVSLRIGNATLRARHADFEPKEWQLYDVEGTTCLRRTPVYYVTSDKVRVTPQQQAVIHQPRVSVLGKFVTELPTQTASLIQAVPGIHYPSPVYKHTRGVGLSLTGGLAVGHQALFDYASRFYAGRQPNGLIEYTHSYLPLERATEVVAPRTDFGERFAYGFQNDVAVKTIDEEDRYFRAQRSTLSFAGQYNSGTADRQRGIQYNKIEAIYQAGGAQGAFGYLGQVRLQGLQEERDSMQPRLKLVGALKGPTVQVQPGLQLITRLDSEGFLGETGYAWIQGTAGLSYHPVGWLRLTGGGYASGDAGTPQFGIDPLYARRGLLGRSDIAFGGFTFSYLIKQDERYGTYDHEFAFTQVIGCFQVFYNKREYPRNRHVGITLNILPFVNAIKQRTAELTGNPVPPAKRP